METVSVADSPPRMAEKRKFVPPASSVMTIRLSLLKSIPISQFQIPNLGIQIAFYQESGIWNLESIVSIPACAASLQNPAINAD
jgi:hypothetical protein